MMHKTQHRTHGRRRMPYEVCNGACSPPELNDPAAAVAAAVVELEDDDVAVPGTEAFYEAHTEQ